MDQTETNVKATIAPGSMIPIVELIPYGKNFVKICFVEYVKDLEKVQNKILDIKSNEDNNFIEIPIDNNHDHTRVMKIQIIRPRCPLGYLVHITEWQVCKIIVTYETSVLGGIMFEVIINFKYFDKINYKRFKTVDWNNLTFKGAFNIIISENIEPQYADEFVKIIKSDFELDTIEEDCLIFADKDKYSKSLKLLSNNSNFIKLCNTIYSKFEAERIKRYGGMNLPDYSNKRIINIDEIKKNPKHLDAIM